MAYINVVDLRQEGFSNPPYTDAWLTARIALVQELFEYLTGRFFEERTSQSFYLNGTGHDTLWLPIPPVTASSITSVVLDGVTMTEDTDFEVVMPSFPDGRFNPKLRKLLGKWNKNTRNVVVTGVFGFVDRELIDAVETSVTPALVKDAIKRMCLHYMPRIGDLEDQNALRIVQESLKDYTYRLERAKSTGFFNDPDIDRIIAMYRKKRMIAV